MPASRLCRFPYFPINNGGHFHGNLLIEGPHQRDKRYHDLGGDYFDKRRPETTAKHLIKRLEALGYTVALQSQTTPVTV